MKVLELLKRLALRFRFTLRYGTLQRLTAGPKDQVLACGHDSIVALPALCPHQGAPLIQARVSGNYAVCPWHGCAFSLKDGKFAASKESILHENDRH